MVHKVLVPEAEYTLLAGKQKFSCYNVIVIILIFFIGFTLIGVLAYNFFKTAIAEEKLANNVKVPSWMHWIWHNSTTNSTAFKSTIKPVDDFIRSVLNTTKTLNLDGLDLDWEFPAWANKAYRQKLHFAQLIYELRKEFDHSGQKLVLSAAVAAPQAIIDQSYEISMLVQHIDFINLMSYDYHFYVWYYPVTDLNSPLYPSSLETGYLTSLNVNFSANYWVLKGMPREKIVIGIPLYGHSYKLDNPANHKLQAPASGYGATGNLGFVTYPDVCKLLKTGAVRVFVNDSHVPYAYKNNEWISYDDTVSVTHKATWIKSNGFKGAMVFSLNSDDWNSTCAPNHGFPLTNAVKKIFTLK